MQLPQQPGWRGLFGSHVASVGRLAAWLLAAGLCPQATPAANPAIKVILQTKRTWDFPGADVHFINEFPGARLNACEQLGDAEFRLVISPENSPIGGIPSYAFKVWSDKPRTITLYLTNTYQGNLRRPCLSHDRVTWKRLPEKAYRFDRQTRTARAMVQIGPRPLWVSAVEMLGVQELEDWMRRVTGLPFARSTVIGESIEGRPIRELILSQTTNANYVFVLGRQHPPEVNGSIGLMSFVDTLARNSSLARRFRRQFQTIVLPLLNPDGVEHGHWRNNLGAVDLNRDWGPFSQPETVAARDALMSFAAQPGGRPFLFLDFHATHTNVFYEQVSSKLAFPEGLTDRWLAAIQRQCRDFHFLRDITNNAALPTWAAATFQVPAITCEFGYGTDPELVRRAARVEAEEMMRLLLAALPPT